MQWLMVLLNTKTVSYCMQNYKPNRLATHGSLDAGQTTALDNDLVSIVALLNKRINPTLDDTVGLSSI